MNEGDIERAVRVLANDEVYGPAAYFLNAYKDIVNANSDGWHIWSYGTKPAGSLEAIVREGLDVQRYGGTVEKTATSDDVKKAIRRIKSFCTRRKLPVPRGISETGDPVRLYEEVTLRVVYGDGASMTAPARYGGRTKGHAYLVYADIGERVHGIVRTTFSDQNGKVYDDATVLVHSMLAFAMRERD